MDVNRATIVGRLTRDPEVRTTPSGINVTSFGVATNFVWTDQEGNRKESVEFHNVVAWRRLGEIVASYLRKGRRVLVEGRLQTRTWEGQDGARRNRTEIVADNVIMLDSKGSTSPAPAASEEDIIIEETAPASANLPPDVSPKASASGEAPSESRGANGGASAKAGVPPEGGTETEEINVEEIPF